MRSSAFRSANNSGFQNLWCVRTDKGGWSQCGQGRKGSIFRDFVRKPFMNGLYHVSSHFSPTEHRRLRFEDFGPFQSTDRACY